MRKCRFIIILIVVSVLALTTLFVACSKKDNEGDVYIILNSEVEVLDKLRVNAPNEKIENAISKGEEINIAIEEKGYVYSWYGTDKNNVRREIIGDQGILKLDAIELKEVFGTSIINLHPDKYYTKLIIDGDNTPYYAIFGENVDRIDPAPEKKNFTFVGYYSDKDGVSERITDEKGNFLGVWNRTEPELMLTPTYAGVSFPFQLDYNVEEEITGYGDSSSVPQKIEYKSTISFKFPIPERDGYDFKGWYTKPSGGNQIVDEKGSYGEDNGIVFDELNFEGDFSNNDEAINVYAHWGLKKYKVTYIFNNVTHIDSIEYGRTIPDHMTEIKESANGWDKSPEGLVFCYWVEKGQDTPFDFINNKQTTRELTLEAVFKKHARDDENAEHILPESNADNYKEKTAICTECGKEVARTLIIIPAGVTEIRQSEFEDYDGLKQILIPDSIEKIGEDAFPNSLDTLFVGSKENFDKVVNSATIIQQNNIWYHVESENDQPSDSGQYWTYDENGIPRKLKVHHVCRYGETVDVSATCLSGGYSYHVCIDCGVKSVLENTEKPALGHNYKNNHKACEGKVCSRCGWVEEKPTADHKFSNPIIDNNRPGSCTENGIRIYTCSECKTKKYEEFIGDHSYQEVKHIDATCTSRGYKLFTCKNCQTNKKEYDESEVLAAHNWSERQAIQISQRLSQIVYSCSECNGRKNEYVDSSNNTYIGINDRDELLAYARNNSQGVNYILLRDIDLQGEAWIPWGSYSGFVGIFDGNGYTINNLSITVEDEDTYGFFTSIFGTVRNLHLKAVIIDAQSSSQSANVGILAGKLSGRVEGVTASGSIRFNAKNGTASIGGLVGSVEKGSVTVSSFSVINNQMDLSANKMLNVGGVAGRVSYEGMMSNVLFDGNLASVSSGNRLNVGGIVGINEGNIYRAISNGSIKISRASSVAVGGLVGSNNGYIGYSLSNCTVQGVAALDNGYDSSGSYSEAYQADRGSDSMASKGVVKVPSTKALSVSWQKELLGNECVLWSFSDQSTPILKNGDNLYQSLNTVYSISEKEQIYDLEGSILKYKLTKDINMRGASFTPISAFYGELSGEGHMISDYRIVNGNYKALISLNYGRVNDLRVEFSSARGFYYPSASEGVVGCNGESIYSYNGENGESHSISSVEYHVTISLALQIVLAVFVPFVLLGILSGVTVIAKRSRRSYGAIALTTQIISLVGLVAVGILAAVRCISQVMVAIISGMIFIFALLNIFIVCIRKLGCDDTLRPLCNTFALINIILSILGIFLAIFLL